MKITPKECTAEELLKALVDLDNKWGPDKPHEAQELVAAIRLELAVRSDK